MTSTVSNGKAIIYVGKATKGRLIDYMRSIPKEEAEKLTEDTGLHFITYDQAVNRLLDNAKGARSVG